jgi:hypothetical protein
MAAASGRVGIGVTGRDLTIGCGTDLRPLMWVQQYLAAKRAQGCPYSF